MLGRKAILHTSKAQQKRKWQVEQAKGSDSSSEGSGYSAGRRKTRDHSESNVPEPNAGTAPDGSKSVTSTDAANAEDSGDGGKKGSGHAQTKTAPFGDGSKEEGDTERGSSLQGKKPRKEFAWMDSDDDADEDDGAKVDEAMKPEAPPPLADPSPPLSLIPPASLLGALKPALGSILRPALRGPAALPPGVHLPPLTQAHLGLMARIGVTRTLHEFWELVDKRCDEFAASHAATSLHKLASLSSVALGVGTGGLPDPMLERHNSFVRLCDRLDELMASADSRATFLPADLAMVAAGLARVVESPRTEGAIGRIFADIADEAETRLAANRLAFTPMMLGDLAWGVSASGNAKSAFLRAIVDASLPKVREASCQDLSSLAAAFGGHSLDEGEALLQKIVAETKVRLRYAPPPTNALFSGILPALAPAVAAAATAAAPALAAPSRVAPPPPPPPAVRPPDVGGPSGTDTAAARPPPKARAEADGTPLWQLTGQWRFTGAQLSEISSAVSRHVRLYEDPLFFELVAAQLAAKLQDMSAAHLQKLRDAFDLVKFRDADADCEFLRALRQAQLRHRELRRLPCKMYRMGTCRFGDRCIHSHTT